MGQKANSLILRSNQNVYESGFKYIYNNYEESTILLYKSIEINSYVKNLFKNYGFTVHKLKFDYSQHVLNVNIFVVSKNRNLLDEFCIQNIDNTKKSSSNLLSCLVTNSLLETLKFYTKSKLIRVNIQDVYNKFLNHIFQSKFNLKTYQEILKNYRKFFKNSVLKEIFIASSVSVFEKGSANFLANFLGKYFSQNKKRHNYLISFLKKVFPVLLKSNFSKATGVKVVVKGRLNGAPRAKTTILQIGQIPLQTLTLEVDYYNQVVHTSNGSFGIKVWICYI